MNCQAYLPVAPPQPTSTPLLDHLRETKAAKGKSKTTKAKATTSNVKAETSKEAALAAVTKAAARRAPQDASGLVMVAGKGRGVTIQANAGGEVDPMSSEGKKPKRTRKPKTGNGAPGEAGGSAKTTPESKSSGKPTPDSKGSTRSGNEAIKSTPSSGGPSQPNTERGGKGGGRGRGKPREGQPGGQGRTAHDTMMNILTKNAEGGGARGGRGGSRGGRGGRGGGVVAGGAREAVSSAAREARIDG